MGLGKTVITLTAIDELIYDWLRVSRVLIIAPKKVAEATWQAEAAKWAHLSRLRFATAMGTQAQRRNAVLSRSDVVVINRENTAWLVKEFREVWPFDMIVFDESSSFKNPTAARFKAIKSVLPRTHRTVILTGTPAPNGIMDIWAQIYLLDQGARLGRYITHYRERFFDFNPWRHEYSAKPGAFEAVQRRIGDLCVSMSAADYLTLPDLVIHDVPVALEPAARKMYEQLEREMVLELGEDEITALNAAAVTGKLLQLCGGCVYDAEGQTHQIHTAKREALAELVEGLNGDHALLFYGYRHELPGIWEALKDYRIRELRSAEDADAWNRGEVDVLVAHPASCAYGLNLQAGGHHVIWYTLSWSLELYQQANARLHRQGQTRPVIVHRLLVQGGMDEDVATALTGKTETQDELLTALKARIQKARREV
jgi:SNF2 family DNA or RNA helicase